MMRNSKKIAYFANIGGYWDYDAYTVYTNKNNELANYIVTLTDIDDSDKIIVFSNIYTQ